MEIWFILTVLSALGFSLTNVFTKSSLKILNNIEYGTLFYIFYFIFTGYLLFEFGKTNYIPNNFILFLIVLDGIIGIAINILYYEAYRHFQLGEVFSFLAFTPFITLLFTLLFGTSSFGILYLIPMFLMSFGIYMIFSGKGLNYSQKISLLIILLILGGIKTYLIHVLLFLEVNKFNILFYSSFFSFVYFGSIFLKNGYHHKINTKKLQAYLFGILAVACSIMASIGELEAFNITNPAIVTSLGKLQIVFVSIISYFILSERYSYKQIFGIGICFLAAIVFSLI